MTEDLPREDPAPKRARRRPVISIYLGSYSVLTCYKILIGAAVLFGLILGDEWLWRLLGG